MVQKVVNLQFWTGWTRIYDTLKFDGARADFDKAYAEDAIVRKKISSNLDHHQFYGRKKNQ